MMKNAVSLLAIIACLHGCASKPNATDVFVDNLRKLCGTAYVGRIVSDDAADDDWRKEEIIAAVQCNRETIRIPVHVGADRSRTWVLTRDYDTLELRHDHRHEDGSEDALSQYGGFSDPEKRGATMVDFPADQSTKELFEREGIPVSKDNIWTLEVDPSRHLLAYELARPNRYFRLEFDTRAPVALPPPAWGADSERPNGF